MSRIEKTRKNAAWSLVYLAVTSLMGFATRWVFMRTLGEEYLGLNGVFTSVLSVLSFAELGLGAAIAYCFYKPVAEDNIPQIVALIHLCRKVFGVIMLVIAGLGLAMMPFLPSLIKDYQGIEHFYLYYLIALVNTVSSYLLVYKTCYQSGCQEGYRTQKISSAFWVATSLAQIICMVCFGNYLLYLLVSCAMNLAEKLVSSILLTRWYPIIRQKMTEPVAPEAVASIKKNVKSLLIINIGAKVVTQSDTLITSRFIGLTTVGLLSNYTLLQNTVTGLINLLPASVTSSMGNLAATEDEDVQLNVLGVYELICAWLAIFSFCGLAVFLSPFIALVFGADKTISDMAVFWLCLSGLLNFQQANLDVIRNSHGAYEVGRSLSFWQAAVNLAVSIPAATVWGLSGVYVGTVASMLVPYLGKPYLIFKHIFHRSSRQFYRAVFSQTASALVIYAVLLAARQLAYGLLPELAAFAVSLLAAVVLFPPLLLLASVRSPYFQQTLSFVGSFIRPFLPPFLRKGEREDP